VSLTIRRSFAEDASAELVVGGGEVFDLGCANVRTPLNSPCNKRTRVFFPRIVSATPDDPSRSTPLSPIVKPRFASPLGRFKLWR